VELASNYELEIYHNPKWLFSHPGWRFFSLQLGNAFPDYLFVGGLQRSDGRHTVGLIFISFRNKSKLQVSAALHSPLAIRYFRIKREIVSKLLLSRFSWRSISY